MCEEHLYFALVYFRWLYQDNFAKGPAHFFDKVLALLRPLVKKMAIRNVRKTLYFQGMGRHSEADIRRLACRGIDALAAVLGVQAWFGGALPCASDATTGAFLVSLLCGQLACPLSEHAQTHANLVAYAKRVQEQFFS